jgi:hypothetical protein
MYEALGWSNDARKLRLFAAGCCRRLVGLLSDRVVRVLDRAERFADGEITERTLTTAWRNVSNPGSHNGSARAWAKSTVSAAISVYSVVDSLKLVTENALRSVEKRSKSVEAAAQATLLRDIFGNPFRKVAFDKEWRTDTVVALARQMYESRDFSAMPILADALQEAGCENDDILSHCRGTGPHVRGCWVVDFVLGKENPLGRAQHRRTRRCT